MKFLLFNVAVAAALVFLFTADRGEVQKIAGQVHDAAGDMKAYANKALNSAPNEFDRRVEPVPASPIRRTERTPDVRPPQSPVVTSAPATTARPEGPSELALARKIARNLPAMPETGWETLPQAGRETSNPAPADIDPAVAQRRREVLDGIETAEAAEATPALKDGARLMTPSERRKELLSLAEEMELLYARSISQ